ncbi:MAG: carboxypeptidase-like regulatory domain-containing protein [Candidatus Acidiferrales bacterium]
MTTLAITPRFGPTLLFLAAFLCLSYPAQGQAGAKLSGVVYYAGAEMPGFPVSLYSHDEVLQTKTDSGGRFEFSRLLPGTYDLEGRSMGVVAITYGIRVENKDVGPLTVTAELKEIFYPLDANCGRSFWVSYKHDTTTDGGDVTGVLVLYPDATNSVLANVRIDLTTADGPHHRISQHVDENGNFEFKNVSPGRYSLVAHSSGYWKVQSTIWVTRKDGAIIKGIVHKHGHPDICE